MKLGDILTGPETWCQGNYESRDKNGVIRYCLAGALIRQLGVNSVLLISSAVREQQFKRLAQAIRMVDTTVADSVSPIEWNDHPDRTWDEVRRVVEAYDDGEEESA